VFVYYLILTPLLLIKEKNGLHVVQIWDFLRTMHQKQEQEQEQEHLAHRKTVNRNF